MPPRGLAILLGAGPTTGSGIARVLARDNLAVALLARNSSSLDSLSKSLKGELPAKPNQCPWKICQSQYYRRNPLYWLSLESSNGGTFHSFPTDTSNAESLRKTFTEIKNHKEFQGLKLEIAIWNIKHSHKTPFEEETAERFGESLNTYVTGAMVFSQECTKWMMGQDPESGSSGGPMQKRGTIIFTGTLGALRTNAGFAAYGAGRSGVRMLAQSLAREYSGKGIHVAHAIANGGIRDGDEEREKIEAGERMRAESVGKTYLWLAEQSCDLWTHELDMRPAAEKF